jgi:hypothetical protein
MLSFAVAADQRSDLRTVSCILLTYMVTAKVDFQLATLVIKNCASMWKSLPEHLQSRFLSFGVGGLRSDDVRSRNLAVSIFLFIVLLCLLQYALLLKS